MGKIKGGHMVVAGIILLAGTGLFFAQQSGKLPPNAAESTTASMTVTEVSTADFDKIFTTKPPADSPSVTAQPKTSAAAGKTTAAGSKSTTKAPAANAAGGGEMKYQDDYPGIHPVVATIDPDKWYLLLVSRDYALPADYAPATEVCLPGVYSANVKMDARVAPYYRRMYNDAKAAGVELTPFSGYRPISRQKTNFDNKIASYESQGYSKEEAVNLAAMTILPPGCSEHEAGLAMDIVNTQVSFETTAAFRWLQENAYKYGFILRYPKDKTAITKISYEPWHWRYVGTETAAAMLGTGLCLEEYLAKKP
ncbi:MAG: M15 family metallopeptidase [Oscillospiraceae bacterium]|jgi:D-alanyl-D-alanine carboxypeptidase|nr:M15 family metallopeptidase [Oscillospiraceae bacterium]